MSGFREPGFADRQKAAQEAKQAILEKFRAQPGPDDPAVKQRQAEREAQAAERAKAKLAREAAKAEQKAREAEAAAEAAAQIIREKKEAAAREFAAFHASVRSAGCTLLTTERSCQQPTNSNQLQTYSRAGKGSCK